MATQTTEPHFSVEQGKADVGGQEHNRRQVEGHPTRRKAEELAEVEWPLFSWPHLSVGEFYGSLLHALDNGGVEAYVSASNCG